VKGKTGWIGSAGTRLPAMTGAHALANTTTTSKTKKNLVFMDILFLSKVVFLELHFSDGILRSMFIMYTTCASVWYY